MFLPQLNGIDVKALRHALYDALFHFHAHLCEIDRWDDERVMSSLKGLYEMARVVWAIEGSRREDGPEPRFTFSD
jgi:hypothetical protein